MDTELNTIKENLLEIYSKFKECKGDLTVFQKDNTNLIEKAVDTAFDIKRLAEKGIFIPNEYRIAAIRSVNLSTLSKIKPTDIEQYMEMMEKIETNNITPPQPPMPEKIYPAPKPTNPPSKKRHINRGKTELKLEENLYTKILRTIRAEPQKNPYKQQHAEYFITRIEEQKEMMQTPNPNPRRTQEQKDAYYSFQIDTLAASTCAPIKWSGLEKECRLISQELSKEPNYDARKLLKFYGIEMACLKIIQKEMLPDELVKIMHELLQNKS